MDTVKTGLCGILIVIGFKSTVRHAEDREFEFSLFRDCYTVSVATCLISGLIHVDSAIVVTQSLLSPIIWNLRISVIIILIKCILETGYYNSIVEYGQIGILFHQTGNELV